MSHLISPAAELLLDKQIPILNGGFVTLVDYMGNDQRIVDNARQSYTTGTKRVNEDRGLIRYLLRHKHTTPFEAVKFTFQLKVPIFVARQIVRHRTASLNEESARYSILKDEFHIPDNLRLQSQTNKQGSEGIYQDVGAIPAISSHCDDAYALYQTMIKDGVTREQARMVLPLNIFTTFYWSIDLWNLMHFLKLRLDPHAQLEVQEVAQQLEIAARAVCPDAMEAWTDYIQQAVSFSRIESEIIKYALNCGCNLIEDYESHFREAGCEPKDSKGNYTREFKEFMDKLGIKYDR